MFEYPGPGVQIILGDKIKKVDVSCIPDFLP